MTPTAPPQPQHYAPLHNVESYDTDDSEEELGDLPASWRMNFDQNLSMANLRSTLLQIEMDDSKMQKRMIKSPKRFRQGASSMQDADKNRLEKVKMYLLTSFGTKKFNGKNDLSILELLTEFNIAQAALNLTESEFYFFLTKAMVGEPHTVMLTHYENHKRKKMSVDDIYVSLTGLYFADLRPEAAEAKIRSFSENKHPFSSLAEAHTEIMRLAHLSSLDLRNRKKQKVFAAGTYKKAILNILPKEYVALAENNIEKVANLRGDDLDPIEILACLNRLRSSIDNAMRRGQEGKNRRGIEAKARKTMADSGDNDATLLIAENASSPLKMDGPAPQSLQKKDWNKGNIQSAAAPSFEGTVNSPPKGCVLCGNPAHLSQNCPLFTGEKGMVGKFPCKHCKTGLRHYHM